MSLVTVVFSSVFSINVGFGVFIYINSISKCCVGVFMCILTVHCTVLY